MTKKFTTTVLSAALAASMLLGGCGSAEKLDPKATLVTVDGEEVVSLGYANFVAKYNQAMYDQIYVSYFGSIDWSQELGDDGSSMQDSVKDQIMEDLERYYVSNLHAADYNIELTEDDEKAIQAAVKKFAKDNTDEAKEQVGFDEEYAVRFLREQTIAQRLQEAVKAEAEVNITDEEAIQSSISYVLYPTTTTDDAGNSVDVSKEEQVALRTSAQALAAADDFAAVAEEQEQNVRTYSYTKAADAAEDTVLGEAVINAAKKLADGETSDVIEVEGTGFYVVHMESVEDDDATATKRENLEKDARTTYYNDKAEAWEKDIDWKVDDKQWSKVTFKKLFTSVETEEETTSEE